MAEDTEINDRIDFFDNSLYDGTGTSEEQIRQVNLNIFSAVVVITKGFGHIEVRAEPSAMMIIVKIKLRWFAKRNWFLKGFMDWQRKQWWEEAIKSCSEHVPDGYRLLLYYEKKDGKFF